MGGKLVVAVFVLLFAWDYIDARPKTTSKDWVAIAKRELDETINKRPNVATAKNVILFIGDGMGMSTSTAARFLKHQEENVELENTNLGWEEFPVTGLSKTYNSDNMVTDSAASGTAMVCGEKINSHTGGVNDKVTKFNCGAVAGNELYSIMKFAQDAGKRTGVVTTSRLTHATPMVTFAHTPYRDWESSIPTSVPNAELCKDIAQQMVTNDAGKNMNVFLGGGSKMFYPDSVLVTEDSGVYGERLDGRNITDV